MVTSCCDMAALKAHIKAMAVEAGAVAAGFARIEPVDADAVADYDRFLDAGGRAEMPYLERYLSIRRDPRLLFEPPASEGTVISMAFPYHHPGPNPLFARYAQGEDYHKVLRRRLKPVARFITENTGLRARVCVDTAPLLERYWAVKSGIGFVGKNRCLIVPGAGSWVFLAEIVTEALMEPDAPSAQSCRGCNACLRRCPHGALTSAGINPAKCLSCLTIEHREALPFTLASRMVYGCDICQAVCPHNAAPAAGLPEFAPTPGMLALTRSDVAAMTAERYDSLFASSAVRRCPLEQLKRNTGMSVAGD